MKDLYKTRYKHRAPKFDYALAVVIAISLFLYIFRVYTKTMQRHGLLVEPSMERAKVED